MGKFMAVMMYLSITIVIGIKDDDLASTPFQPSSEQTSLPHPSELGPRPFYTCLEENVENCKKMQKEDPKAHKNCITRSFYHCKGKIHPFDPYI